ncbi:uncharacterized protein LOC129779196 [Toxorhynchites rutilus septentrionalis]|uniref:uncharacterized protein LOC129779196 n=1 Tax=Toxorhynchites rutilus septentrionalis TaxID=329112 RepID=UPI00247A0B71|nr:uncharacterized protein LOC129779196 [Toxorhynchites rutilus septentrionalis]
MDFVSSYNRFTRKLKERLFSIKNNISKDVAEWKSKLALAEQTGGRLNNLISSVETCNELNNKLESKFIVFERRILELENEKHQMKVDIQNLQEEKCQLLNKLNNFEELKQFNHKLDTTLEREIREKNNLKVKVDNSFQEIGRLEKRFKVLKNSHLNIKNEKQLLEKKIERLKKQHTESKKADRENIHKWKTSFEQYETKLRDSECVKLQLAEKNSRLKETNRETSKEVLKLRTMLQENELVFNQEKRRIKEGNMQLDKWMKRNHELNTLIKHLETEMNILKDEKTELIISTNNKEIKIDTLRAELNQNKSTIAIAEREQRSGNNEAGTTEWSPGK